MKKLLVLISFIICLFILIAGIQLLMDGKSPVDIHIHDTYFVIGRKQIIGVVIVFTLLSAILISKTVGLNKKR